MYLLQSQNKYLGAPDTPRVFEKYLEALKNCGAFTKSEIIFKNLQESLKTI